MENSNKKALHEGDSSSKGLDFEATELRLGLPGSHSLEGDDCVEDKHAYPNTILKVLVSAGAKRTFSDTVNGGSEWWVDGSEGGLARIGDLFSPKDGTHNQSVMAAGIVKEDALPQSPKTAAQQEKKPQIPAAKAQVVGWPPIRSFRKNSMSATASKANEDGDAKSGVGCLYVKVSMDGAPYLRKVDLKIYSSYNDLSADLGKMFSCFTIGQCGNDGVPSLNGSSETQSRDLFHGSEYVLTFEDKDGDWMLVGDVPWEMFTDYCKRIRITKSSEASGLAPRATEKCKN